MVRLAHVGPGHAGQKSFLAFQRRVRQAKPGREGNYVTDNMMEISYWDLAGFSPARQRLATSRNRVLRGAGVTLAAKRTQGVTRPCDSAPKGDCFRGRHCFLSGRQHGSNRNSLVRAALRGRRAGHGDIEVLQEPGRSPILPCAVSGAGAALRKGPGGRRCVTPHRANSAQAQGYTPRKGRGWDGRNRSLLIVPTKWANASRAEPMEGRGRSGQGA